MAASWTASTASRAPRRRCFSAWVRLVCCHEGARVIGVAVLGSTGSVGESTLEVIALHPQRFQVVALGARRNVQKLAEQVRRWKPRYAVLADREAAGALARELARGGERTE